MKTLRYRIGNNVKPGILDQEGNILNAEADVDYAHKKVLQYCMPKGFEPYTEMLHKISKGNFND